MRLLYLLLDITWLLPHRWITTSAGVGEGAKANFGSVGVRYSNSRIGIGFDGKIRIASVIRPNN